VKKPKGGAISFAQRFASNLSIHPHLHLVIPDGVFFADSFGQAQFHRLPKPKVEDLETIASQIYRRIGRWLEHHPVLEEPRDGLAINYASTEGLQPLPLFPLSERPKHPGKLEARVEGFSLEAGRHVHPNDREALERLCKYGARPPLAMERISCTSEGQILLRFKRILWDGSTQVRLSPTEFLRRLAGLVPPPKLRLGPTFEQKFPQSDRQAKVGMRQPQRLAIQKS
jgi:hypothetical protein